MGTSETSRVAKHGPRVRALLVDVDVDAFAAAAEAVIDEFDYVCQCSSRSCSSSVRLSRTAYARVSDTPGWFVVAADHDLPDEHVVERGDGFVVVARSG